VALILLLREVWKEWLEQEAAWERGKRGNDSEEQERAME